MYEIEKNTVISVRLSRTISREALSICIQENSVIIIPSLCIWLKYVPFNHNCKDRRHSGIPIKSYLTIMVHQKRLR